MGDRLAKPGRVDDIVGVDDADDLDVRGDVGECPVEGTRRVARPGREVDERDVMARLSESGARGLDRLPERWIGRVVVDDLNPEAWVVERGQRADRLDDEFGWLVERRHLERDERPRFGGGGRRRLHGWS